MSVIKLIEQRKRICVVQNTCFYLSILLIFKDMQLRKLHETKDSLFSGFYNNWLDFHFLCGSLDSTGGEKKYKS